MRYAAARDGAAEQPAQLLGGRGAGFGELLADLALADELRERGVHRLHARGGAGLQHRVDLVCLALSDQVADRGRRDEHLARHDATGAVGVGQQLLGHDPLQRDGELDAHLTLLVGGEHVDDAVDRLRGVLRVQRGEDQVTGLGGGQGRGDRLEVAHLADQDHVGVLAQRGLQGVAEAVRVGAELALVDEALLVPVQELDRVLDRHDVLLARGVDLVDHRRERGGLARAGRARDEHEAARPPRELVDRGREAELVDRGQPEGDQAEGRAERAALVVGVDTEARVPGDRVGEVELPVRLQALALVPGQDRVDDLAGVRAGELGVFLQRRQPAAHADGRVGAGAEVQIGRTAVDDLHQEVSEIDVHGVPIGSKSRFQEREGAGGRKIDVPEGRRRRMRRLPEGRMRPSVGVAHVRLLGVGTCADPRTGACAGPNSRPF